VREWMFRSRCISSLHGKASTLFKQQLNTETVFGHRENGSGCHVLFWGLGRDNAAHAVPVLTTWGEPHCILFTDTKD